MSDQDPDALPFGLRWAVESPYAPPLGELPFALLPPRLRRAVTVIRSMPLDELPHAVRNNRLGMAVAIFIMLRQALPEADTIGDAVGGMGLNISNFHALSTVADFPLEALSGDHWPAAFGRLNDFQLQQLWDASQARIGAQRRRRQRGRR
jgi:hypothetical protein